MKEKARETIHIRGGASPALHSKVLPIPCIQRASSHPSHGSHSLRAVNSPVGLLQHRWGAPACSLTPPGAGSSHRSPHPQAVAAGGEAIHAAVGWQPMGRCPLPTWRGLPRGHAFRRAGKRQRIQSGSRLRLLCYPSLAA